MPIVSSYWLQMWTWSLAAEYSTYVYVHTQLFTHSLCTYEAVTHHVYTLAHTCTQSST